MIRKYHSLAEKAIQAWLETLGSSGELRDACAYAMTSGGKLLRPILVFMTADALGFGTNVTPVAVRIECFQVPPLLSYYFSLPF